MKLFATWLMAVCLVSGISAHAYGASQSSAGGNAKGGHKPGPPTSIKGAQVKPGPFRVKQVTFKKVTVNNQTHLAVAVVFNRKVDAATVKPNNNIRLLMKNKSHQWVDVTTQNNKVNVRPQHVTWLTGKPISSGIYIMHLRGTIKSADGVYLDCDGDGKGEGGNLPAYESKMYQVVVKLLDPHERDRLEGLKDRQRE